MNLVALTLIAFSIFPVPRITIPSFTDIEIGESLQAQYVTKFTNGKNERVAVVMYTIDGSKPADRKVGFVKYIAGIGK